MKSAATQLLIASALLLSTSFAAHAKDDPVGSDKRINQQLQAADLKYTIDDDGDYRLLFSTKDERSQQVFMKASTERYDDFEIREIFSPVLQPDKPMSTALMSKLLAHNNTVKIGAWRTMGPPDALTLVFAVQLDAAANQSTLLSVLEAVVNTADDMELELSGEDRF